MDNISLRFKNTGSPPYGGDVGISATSESWSATIDDDYVASTSADGAVRSGTLCAPSTKPIVDVSAATVVSDSAKRAHDYIPKTSKRETIAYNRRAKRWLHDDDSEAEGTDEDKGHVVDFSSRFPTEIYENIIDYVAEIFYNFRWRDLASCALVCRAWVPRAQMHLFSVIVPHFIYNDRQFSSVRHAIRRKPFLLQYIKTFNANYNDKMPQPTTVLTTYRMPSLKQCRISSLDLKTAHSSLFRFPTSATSLHLLDLYECKTGDVNQLCRFLTSFRSLSTLALLWDNSTIFYDHSLSHLQFNRSKSSLQTLAIQLIPNISLLLKSFIKARSFVTHLKHFIISGDVLPNPFQEITELLQHCSQSLEEATLILGGFQIEPYGSLSSLTLHIGAWKGSVKEENLFGDVRRLDDLLSGEMFRSFRKLRIKVVGMYLIEFPKLKARKVEVEISEEDEWISL
ncbi:hypothetical protein QCA50_013512 [Cerrena zonata]|uniref:F-box domain-containing protein n=1 Tax=Cerrena zonata TaxID=2478898 RepID=A0AAW0FPN2_9APHY